jgi:addiction module HigA family antidote
MAGIVQNNNREENMGSEDITKVPPAHPGKFMKSWLMDRRNISAEELAKGTELPEQRIHDLIAGTAPVDRPTAMKLSRVFGGTAETLYRMQYELDYYKENETLPSYEQLPSLDL